MTKAAEAKDVEARVTEFEDLWEKLDKLVQESSEQNAPQPPPNSFSADQYAKRCGMRKSSVQHKLFELVKQGKLTRVKVGYRYWYSLK